MISILTCLVAAVVAKTPNGANRVLILHDNPAVYVTHSMLFQTLKGTLIINDSSDQNYRYEIKSLTSPNINLMSYGEYNYDHLLIFASSDDELKSFKPKEVTEFFDSGRNVVLLGNVDQNRVFRHLTNAFGVDMDELGSQVFDHFNNVNPTDPTTVSTANVVRKSAFVAALDKPVMYRGSGLSLTNFETNQVYGLVRGSETAYSRKSDQDDTVIVGSNIVYVAATQGRNNARVLITGGWDIFSNEFLANSDYDNQKLMEGLLKWTFGQNGILRAGQLVHKRVGSDETFPQNYKLSEDVYFATEIWQWDSDSDKWVPFNAPEGDILMEFVMLDPYYRIPLKQNAKEPAKYEVEFKIPDKYGIFHFRVNYFRPGYSFLRIAEKITVRPFRHDEYPRYLVQAYPYYLSTFGTIAGFLVFLLFFLFHRDPQKQE